MFSRSLSMNLNCTCLPVFRFTSLGRTEDCGSRIPRVYPQDKPEDLCSGRKGLLILRKGPCKVLPFDSRTMGQDVRGRCLPSNGKSGTQPRGSRGSQWLEAEPSSAAAVMNHHPMKLISLRFWFPSWWKMQDFNKVAEQMELIYSLQLHSSYCILLCFPFLIGAFCFPSRTRVHKTFPVKGSKYFRLSVSHVSVAYSAWLFVFTIF